VGTSQSSGGPPSGVPMVPPWVPDPPPATPPVDSDVLPTDGDTGSGSAQSGAPPPPVPTLAPIAPQGRFTGARRSLGRVAHTGDHRAMRRGLGQYVRHGYGGSGTAVRRFGGTASTAGVLYAALSAVASGQTAAPGSPLDPALLAGRSAQEVIDAVVEAVRPIDGTQDAESGRAAIRDALSDLLTRYPDADLISLTEEQRTFAIERYVAIDVYRRFDLDLGKTIRGKAASAVIGLSRMREVKDYVKETVAAVFRRLRDAGRIITAGRVGAVVRAALSDSLQVFEGYAT
jgi:hypothetical protein